MVPRKAVFILVDGIPADVIERVATSAIVDIAPSILQHLRFTVPIAVAQAMDGVSFLKPRAK